MIWAIKDESITSTFIDAGAAQFFLPQLSEDKKPSEPTVKRAKYRLQSEGYCNVLYHSKCNSLNKIFSSILECVIFIAKL